MSDAAESLFEQLATYASLEDVIAAGESEGLHLECKAPSEPRLTKDQKTSLSTAISGFSNTAGGVLVYGLSTTKHQHTGLDVITQVEPIGQVAKLEQQIRLAIPTSTTPRILNSRTRVVKKKASDTCGVVVVYVPLTDGDPVQSTNDNIFYIRTGDDFRPAPYEIIKRLFSAVDNPDLRIIFDDRLVKLTKEGSWDIPVILSNESPAIAEPIQVSATIKNPEAIESVHPSQLHDASSLNPGQRIFMKNLGGVVHRGLRVVVGSLKVKMKGGTRAKRRLDLEIAVYANKMRARRMTCSLSLAKSGFSVRNVSYSNVY